MNESLYEIEGTWEEITKHESELRGHRVKLIVIDKIPVIMKTERGKKFATLREAIVASGEPLLNAEELDREIRERRGEYDQDVS